MSKHSQSNSGKPDPKPNDHGAQHHQCDVSGSIHVRGEIETRIPPDLAKKRDSAENKKETRDKNRYLVEVLTLVFLILYASITGIQAYLALDSNDISRQSLQSVQRAFLSFHEIISNNIATVTDAGSMTTTEYTAAFLDDGNTPAVNVRGVFTVEQMAREIDDQDFTKHMPYSEPTYVGPKGTFGLGPMQKGPEFLGADILSKDFGAKTISVYGYKYLWGMVTYHDVFPKTKIHLTEFCLQLIGVIKADKTGQLIPKYTTCKKHNCNDEYCPDYDAATKSKR